MAKLIRQFKDQNKEAKEFLRKNGKYNKDGELVLNEGIRTSLLAIDPVVTTNILKFKGTEIFSRTEVCYNKTKSELITKI